MPTILRVERYRFAFYSNEGGEPPHIHVYAAERESKFWLETLELEENDGFRSNEISDIRRILKQHQAQLLEAWHEYFKGR